MRTICLDDLDLGDNIRVLLKTGQEISGTAYGIVKDKSRNKYYLELNAGKKHIKSICTVDIVKLTKF